MGSLLTASKITYSFLLLQDSFPRQLWGKTFLQASTGLWETVRSIAKGKISTLATHFCGENGFCLSANSTRWISLKTLLQWRQPEIVTAAGLGKQVLMIPRPQKKSHTKNSAWPLNLSLKYQPFLVTYKYFQEISTLIQKYHLLPGLITE